MRHRTTSIVTIRKAESPQEWRRFAAIICFMTFYTTFVRQGHRFWLDGLAAYGRGVPDRDFYAGLAGLLLAAILYLAGRSLWYAGRWTRLWLLLAIICVVGSAFVDLSFQRHFNYWGPLTSYNFIQIGQAAGYLCALSKEFPLLGVLAVALWASRRGSHPKRLRLWVQLALIWALLSIGSALAEDWLAYRLKDVFSVIAARPLTLLVTLAIPAGASIMLLMASPAARWPAWIGAATAIADSLLGAYLLVMLVDTAIQGLLISGIPGRLPDWSPYPLGCALLNRSTFFFVFVDLVLDAGPWILIALFAGKYPMRVPPDDGSPFPRRYCGRCWYNLHGIDLSVCPECGRQLAEP